MSRENVELVRRATAAYNRADIDGMLEDWAPDAVLDWSHSRGLEAGLVRGREKIRAYILGFLEMFDDVRLELVGDPVEVEEGVVVAENVAYMRGRDGVEVQARSAWLVTIRDGEQTSLTLYQSRQEALEAAALEG